MTDKHMAEDYVCSLRMELTLPTTAAGHGMRPPYKLCEINMQLRDACECHPSPPCAMHHPPVGAGGPDDAAPLPVHVHTAVGNSCLAFPGNSLRAP